MTQPPAAGKPTVDSALTLEIARITERVAIATARWRGRGEERQADEAALGALHEALAGLDIRGRIVIGEGQGAPLLGLGQAVGTGLGPEIDVAVDPLEGVTATAKGLGDALTAMAFAERGGLLSVPDAYMEKIAIGPGYPEGIVDLDRSVRANIEALAQAKGVPVTDITACLLDRPRHAGLIAQLRELGVAVKLLPDGDIAAIIHAASSDDTGIDIYLGSGGAPEGVLAAVAIRCMGGQMQGRLILDTPDKKAQARALGLGDPDAKFSARDMAHGDVLFAATGITDGSLLEGVKFLPGKIVTSSVTMRSRSGIIRWITAEQQRRSG